MDNKDVEIVHIDKKTKQSEWGPYLLEGKEQEDGSKVIDLESIERSLFPQEKNGEII